MVDQTSKELTYHAAFRYTAKAGGYEGVITWTAFASKADFDKSCNGTHLLDKQEIVEEGITRERAIALCKTTPARSRLLAALAEATDPESGSVNIFLLRMGLMQALDVIEIDQS